MNKLENKVIYQIYPKSFMDSNNDGIGDLKGIISKLDYLKNLGVDYIWLSPINKSPQNDNGYDISDYYRIDEMFGDIEDFKLLIKEAKARSIKIMMDLVLNHTSTDHEWFQNAINNDPEYLDYYIFQDQPTNINSIFGGSAWNYVPALDKYYFCFFDKTQADLNWENPKVRQELYYMINFWIDLGVQGFRLDVIEHISKDLKNGINCKGPRYLEFLKELNNNTFKDELLTVGECWFASVDQMNDMCHKDGLYQAFHFAEIVHTSGPTGKWDQVPFNLKQLSSTIKEWQNDYRGCNAIVMNNHDLPRLVSLWLDDKNYRYESATLLITIFGLLKGNLYLYQGEEIGMCNAYEDKIDLYNDIESRNYYLEQKAHNIDEEEIMSKIMTVSRDNARSVMQWNNQVNAGFSSVKPWTFVNKRYQEINVENDINSNNSIFNYYQEIIKFRKSNYELIQNKIDYIINENILVITRKGFTIVANFSSSNYKYKIDDKEIIFNNYKGSITNDVKPYQVVVFK